VPLLPCYKLQVILNLSIEKEYLTRKDQVQNYENDQCTQNSVKNERLNFL
jgi:hypothetical protein